MQTTSGGRPLHSLAEDLALTLGAAVDRESSEPLRRTGPTRGIKTDPLSHLTAREPVDERDSLLTLLQIHDLWMAPIETLGGKEAFQSHPVIADLKWRLEGDFVERLHAEAERSISELALHPGPSSPDTTPKERVIATIRRVAAHDLVPEVYEWLANVATWDQLVRFLTLEGGPDAGFDDLVALSQVGIRNGPKVVLAANYWDEMGRGELNGVHTVLHDQLVAAINMPRLKRDELPISALARLAVGGLLATNRYLQPEALGAFGLIELQAGPRCRAVIRALTRLDAPEGAFAFYEEHARADPHHGKAWLDGVIGVLAADHDGWAERMVCGAVWRQNVNTRFFAEAHELCSVRTQFAANGAGEPSS
ncbi:MAG: iron-containing redox enzyme family protein [Microthrixaceae bacterium]